MAVHSFRGWDAFTANLIRRKAHSLVGKAGITRSDVSGLAEELAFDLYRRKHKFDPTRGTWGAFATHVLDNCCATIIKHRRAQKRAPRCKVVPISDIPRDVVELAQFFPERASRSHTHESDVRIDNEGAMRSLPEELRAVCQRVMEGASMQKIADHFDVHPSTVSRWFQEIRRLYAKSGMQDYLD